MSSRYSRLPMLELNNGQHNNGKLKTQKERVPSFSVDCNYCLHSLYLSASFLRVEMLRNVAGIATAFSSRPTETMESIDLV